MTFLHRFLLHINTSIPRVYITKVLPEYDTHTLCKYFLKLYLDTHHMFKL